MWQKYVDSVLFESSEDGSRSIWMCEALDDYIAKCFQASLTFRNPVFQYPGILNISNQCQYYTFCLLTLCLFSLPGDMDIYVLSKYISERKRVYPGVEGRITVTASGSSSSTAHSLGVLLLPLCLALIL